MLMNVLVVHPTTAISTQIVITLMAHFNALVKVGTVGMVAAAAMVCKPYHRLHLCSVLAKCLKKGDSWTVSRSVLKMLRYHISSV